MAKLELRNCANVTNLVPVRAAISDRKTNILLFNVSDEPWAWETHEDSSGAASTLTVSDIISQNESGIPFIVKVNIEGYEVELFRSNLDWVSQTALVVYESHDRLFHWRGTAHAIQSVLCRQPRDYLQRSWNTFAFSHFLSTYS
jgi:hypothetical protein